MKNLVSELGGATPRTEKGAPSRVKPSSAERFHERLQTKRNQLADEIAEENMTPNMVLDHQMSKPFMSSNPLHSNPEERDTIVPPDIQIGHMVSDAQRSLLPQAHEMPAPLSFAEVQRMKGSRLQGPLPYEQFRQFPDEPTNPFKVGKSSPFDLAWTILKEDLNYLQDAIHSMQRLFGVDYDKAVEMVEQMHRHQLTQAGIPQNKVMRESADASEPASDYLNQQFAKPLAIELGDMVDNMHQLQDYQQYKDDNSRRIGQRTSNEAFARRGLRGNPRVPQTSEEASYANISIPRESPIHGLEPFGQDEPMGATMPMPMADDILEPIRQRRREQEPFNPFTARPPSTPPPMRQEQEEAPGGTEALSRGPLRSRKRGDPARNPRFKRPGFRGPDMPMTDESAEVRG